MPRSCAVTTLATVVGVTLLVAGCSGDDAPADVAETPPAEESLSEASSEPALDINLDDDWTLAEGSGYQVGLPPGWFDAGRALADEEFMAEISRGIDDLIDDEGMQEMLREGVAGEIDLLAFRTADLGSEFATNFNVVVQDRGPIDEPEVLRDVVPDLLASVGGDVTNIDEYDVRGMPNVEVTYDLALPGGMVVGIQNYVFTEDVIYVATYTAIEPDRELWAAVLETFTPETF